MRSVHKRIRICVFFIFTFILCLLYGVFYVLHPEWRLEEILLDDPCEESFGKTIQEDIEKVRSYPFEAANKYLRELTPALHPEIIFKGPDTTNIELPAIVSGASSNHVHEIVAMFDNLNTLVRPAYPTIPVYFFDLGLSSSQKAKVTEICNCTVVPFPFDRFPYHVSKLYAYCWKPLIIALMLQTYQFVMWMDSSIQFKTNDLDSFFIKAKKEGVLAKYDGFLLPSHTLQETYTFLQETPCVFRISGEFSASLILFHNGNDIVRNFFIKPWVSCALIEDCMKTRRAEWSHLIIRLCMTHQHYFACHRYDQSVFGLLMHRLFHDSYTEHDFGGGIANWCRELDCG